MLRRGKSVEIAHNPNHSRTVDIRMSMSSDHTYDRLRETVYSDLIIGIASAIDGTVASDDDAAGSVIVTVQYLLQSADLGLVGSLVADPAMWHQLNRRISIPISFLNSVGPHVDQPH